MPIEYTNRKNQTYYLHQGVTKTGKPKYYFSLKREGTLADAIPDSFEIYEEPNARVYLRKKRPQIITPDEIEVAKQGMAQFSPTEYYQIDVKKNAIIIYTVDQNVDALSELLPYAPIAASKKLEDLLAEVTTYSPVLQFVLLDKEQRTFIAQRYNFVADDWRGIGRPDTLKNLVEKYAPHLEQDSFYSLH